MKQDILEAVLDDVLKLQKLIDGLQESCKTGAEESDKESGEGKEAGVEKLGAAVTRRVEDLPGLIYMSGFIPAVTFYMSKADGKLYKYLYDKFHNNKIGENEENYLRDLLNISFKEKHEHVSKKINEFYKKLCSEIGGKESAGYNLSLVLIASALERLGLLDGATPDTLQELAKVLQELRTKGRDAKAARLVADYMIEAKKLLKAFYGAAED